MRAGLNFVLWGVYYGILLVLERWKLKQWLEKPSFFFLGHIYTMLAVMIGWVFFRAENLEHACMYCHKLFGFNNNEKLLWGDFMTWPLVLLILTAILFAGPIPRLQCFRNEIDRENIRWFDYIVQPILLAAVLLLLAGNTYNPFIYFRF